VPRSPPCAQDLRLYGNGLSGTLPATLTVGLGIAANILHLDLSDNTLTGSPVPLYTGNLPYIEHLNLAKNK
jgi:hypothetical protein